MHIENFTDGVKVTLSEGDVENLISVLGIVSDQSPEQTTEKLYCALTELGYEDNREVFTEPNKMYDPEDDSFGTTHNVVLR
jgi:hypothetical protein